MSAAYPPVVDPEAVVSPLEHQISIDLGPLLGMLTVPVWCFATDWMRPVLLTTDAILRERFPRRVRVHGPVNRRPVDEVLHWNGWQI